ncbi:MAG: SpoIVB peptidase S55 domain-containing protein, partial [Pyrinomonadaceae bacterium]
MRGKAKTVFRGTEPEEFDVEILGVLPNAIGPNQDLIIGKISGSQVEKTAVFAGMSGSPVFVDGKLIGAISYSFPFSKEPICGITPIEQMIGIFSDTEKTRPMQVKKVFSESEIHGTARQFSISTDTQKANIFEQAFQPIATPVAFSGFTPQTLELFSSQLKALGLLPVSSVGGSSKNRVFKKYDEKTLQPGSSVAMELTRGDYSITAYGTVTFRDGENVYAFGHPFLNLGVSNLPMSESKVVAIVPSIYNSFKLAVSDATVGTMTQDRNTGVLGKLGQEPKMIPVEISLKTSRGKNEKVY